MDTKGSAPVDGIFYCGDNLEVLKRKVPTESVDLVYLDPPFNSRRMFNVVYKGSQAQELAFKDYWSWDEAAPVYSTLLESVWIPPNIRTLLRGLRDLLIDSDADLLAYLTMMTPRLVELHRVLKQTGSLYLHCDPTASHYLKMVLDSVFGTGRFLNEIIWQRTVPKSLMTRRLPNNHDVILLYSKGDEPRWNSDAVFAPYDERALDEKTAKKYSLRDNDGRRYQLTSLLNPNPDRPNLTYEFMGVKRVWRWTRERMEAARKQGIVVQTKPGSAPRLKRYLDEQRGRPLGDVWVDIYPVNSMADERLGYPTQKPIALLGRLLGLASHEGDLVLDPFCGSGTTIEACERMARRWVGIDIAAKAVEITQKRFKRLEIPLPEIEWMPPDMDAAKALAKLGLGG